MLVVGATRTGSLTKEKFKLHGHTFEFCYRGNISFVGCKNSSLNTWCFWLFFFLKIRFSSSLMHPWPSKRTVEASALQWKPYSALNIDSICRARSATCLRPFWRRSLEDPNVTRFREQGVLVTLKTIPVRFCSSGQYKSHKKSKKWLKLVLLTNIFHFSC